MRCTAAARSPAEPFLDLLPFLPVFSGVASIAGCLSSILLKWPSPFPSFRKMEAFSNNLNAGLKSKVLRRLGYPLLALALSAAFIIALVKFGPVDRLPQLPSLDGIGLGNSEPAITTPPDEIPPPPKHTEKRPYNLCSLDPDEKEAHVLKQIKAKYYNLMEDKFTIAMQTYKRPEELNRTLYELTSEHIPSLHEIVVVWNDLEEAPPPDFKRNDVPIRYKVSARNSLNSRLHPDPSYKTQAILLTDDDVYYKPQDLEFVFQAWREFGHERLAGALARCSTIDHEKGDSWKYGFCSRKEGEDNYSMVLTNLAFSHIAFMDYYSSENPVSTKLRAYVDEHFNCEDIAMNFVHSYLTRTGPLLVTGNEKYVNYEPKEGISRKPGHLAARSQCLNDFAEFYGCMPLMNTTTHASRGVVPL
ncbi:Exostosin-2 [Paramyrothecium foliicola]|nr:Exostosin-2 [Paramyrothecium foliicola]